MKKVCLTSLSLFSMTVAASLQAHAGATNFTTFANPANTAVQKTFGTAARNQQQETIRGIVLDNEGNPLAGVTIREEDGRTTTSSNAKRGYFKPSCTSPLFST